MSPANNFGQGQLQAIFRKLTQKDPSNRYGSADEVQRDLKKLRDSLGPRRTLSKRAWIVVAVSVILVWLWARSLRDRWALARAIPEITRLVESGEYVKAEALAQEVRRVLPHDPTVDKLEARDGRSLDRQCALRCGGFHSTLSRRSGRLEDARKDPLVKLRVPRSLTA